MSARRLAIYRRFLWFEAARGVSYARHAVTGQWLAYWHAMGARTL
jgi:hypothetical protein